MNHLSADEKVLRGGWTDTPDGLKPDETALRIEALTAHSLVKLGTDPSGWETLYVDPRDNRFWELTFPDSDSQGGGPPMLKNMSIAEATGKYPSVNDPARQAPSSG
jgi:hypothetical protein